MKVIVGIDRSEECVRALELLAALRFRSVALELAHVVEPPPVSAYGDFPLPADVLDKLSRESDEEGKRVLAHAEEALAREDTPVTTSLLHGLTANALMAHAAETHTDLVAVGSTRKRLLERFLVGSVSRKLIAGAPCSVLVAKREPVTNPLDAVIATDHSDYAERCMERLREMAPLGLAKITVLTAFPIRSSGPAHDVIHRNLEEKNAALIRRFADAMPGVALEGRVSETSAEEAIDSAMRDTRAGLLILGAHGHGFIERVTIGSLSYMEATTGSHHTLIVRV